MDNGAIYCGSAKHFAAIYRVVLNISERRSIYGILLKKADG